MAKMTNKTLTAAEAKANWASSLRQVEQGGTVVITRYGQPVAALVGIEDLEQLKRLRSKSRKAGLAGLVHRWDDTEDFVAALDEMDRSSQRPPLDLD